MIIAQKGIKMNKSSKHDYAMKGCICKKQTSPYYYAEITYRQTDGAVKRISKTTKCKRKYDAGKRMEEMISELKKELISSNKNNHELTRFIYDWLEKVESKEIEVTTLETYRRHFTAYIKPYFEPLNLTVEELRPSDLWDFAEYLQAQTTKNGESIKTCSIKKVLSNIKLAMDYAIKKEIIEMNPADVVKLKTKRKEKYDHSFYTIDQLIQLWKAVRGTLYEPAVVLASIYGLRRGEVSGLKWDKVDFENQCIHVEETIVYAGSKPHIKDTKTEASMRDMPIISPVKLYLQRVLESQRKQADQIGSAWVNSGYVIIDELGVPLRPLRISNNFRRLLEVNNLPHIRFHDLRHSVATYMLSMGVPIADISAWLGHKSVTTTSNIYAHVTDDMRKNTARWMDSGYDPDKNRSEEKVTLEEAIQKLFKTTFSSDEGYPEELTALQAGQSPKKLPYDYQKYRDEQEKTKESFGERAKLRVIRGNLA